MTRGNAETSVIPTENDSIQEDSGWLPQWLSWSPTSQLLLYAAETRLLSRVRAVLETFYVPVLERSCRLRTLIARSATLGKTLNYRQRMPIVMVHGMGAGVGFWCKNLDALAANRTVYAFDLVGFGRSSRPDFPTDAQGAEEMFVRSIEDWRASLNLEKFIMVGHSLGGYLSCSYAIKYPERVAHIVMVDPWGFPEYTPSIKRRRGYALFRAISFLISPFNPLGILRGAGPFGPMLVRRFRNDLSQMFDEAVPKTEDELESSDEQSTVPGEPGWLLAEAVLGSDSELAQAGRVAPEGCICDYIYHCNAQKPSGECGFKAMSQPLGWAVRPMLGRIQELSSSVPMTFIYGGRSWMDSQSGFNASFLRSDAYVDIKVIDGAGHHVYAQGAPEFNGYITGLCRRVDQGDPFEPGSEPPGPLVILRGSAEMAAQRAARGRPSSLRHRYSLAPPNEYEIVDDEVSS